MNNYEIVARIMLEYDINKFGHGLLTLANVYQFNMKLID